MIRRRAIRLSFLAIGLIPCLAGAEGLAANGAPETPSVVASPRLSWEDAIKTGVARHPLIEAARHGALEADAVTQQIAAVNYPQVSGFLVGSGGNTRVLSNLGVSGSLPKPTNYLGTPGVRVDLLVTDFGRTAHKILANKALTASAEKQVLTSKALVILNVQQAYLTCLRRQKLVEIAREVLAERRLIQDQAEALYKRQLKSKLDLDLAAVETAKAELELIKAQNDLQTALVALNTAMGIQGPEQYVLEEIQPTVSPAVPIEPLFRDALARRPELLGSQDRAQAAEEALKAAQALHYGSISAIGSTGYTWWGRQEVVNARGNPNNPNEQVGWWGAGVASSTPLFTGFRIQSEVEEAAAHRQEARAATKALANDVLLQVAKAYVTRLTAAQQIAVAQERVAHAREALTLARERYKAGLSSILDVTTATADLLRAEVGLADAQYDYLGGESALAYATGTDYGRY